MDRNTPEKETLARYLDHHRRITVWKLNGLTEEQARWSPVPSGTSLLGIAKHLAYVERWWFQAVIGEQVVDFPGGPDDTDADWRIETGEDIATITALHDAECNRSREILSGITDLDAVRGVGNEDVSIRRILVHMVEETARHNGHADIIREMIDGSTGEAPSD
jgi:uncharacterized damage-inducible protein DinB